MSKTFTQTLKGGRLVRLLLLAVLTLAGTLGAKAVEKDAMTQIVVGETYTMPSFSTNYYYYEATATGKLTLSGTKVPRLYTDNTFTTMGTDNINAAANKSSIDVESGKTYYFQSTYEFDSKTFTASFEAGEIGVINITSVSPEAGSVFSLSSSSVYVNFDADIEIDDVTATITGGGKTVDATVAGGSKKAVVSVKSTIYEWLTDGTLKEGDKFQVKLAGIHSEASADNLYGTDGTFSVEYIAPASIVGLNEAETKVPATLKSYWNSGDEEGYIKLVFSGALSTETAPTATLTFGKSDNGDSDYYTETLPVSVANNTITVDLTGKTRTASSMLPNATAVYSYVNIKVSGVKDAEGNLTYSSKDGSNGSYTYTLALDEVSEDVFAYDFTPADGSLIDGTDSLEIWLSSVNAISFTGVKFDYVKNDKSYTTTVANADITTVEDNVDGGYLVNVPVPADVKGGKALNVKVTLDGQTSKDGVERDVISAEYNTLTLKMVAPVAGSVIDSLHTSDSLKVQLLPAELDDRIGVIYYDIENAATGEVVHSGYMNKALGCKLGNGLWGTDYPSDYALLEGSDYTVSARAYCQDSKISSKTPLATDTVIVTGAAKAYQYSDYKLVSVTPDPDTYLIEKAEDAVVTLTFDGPVLINHDIAFINTGFGTSTPFTKITALDAADGSRYAKTWQVDASGFVKLQGNGAPINFSIAAIDEQGRRVKGNGGLEETSYFDYLYECTVGVPRISFSPANGSTVDSIKTITLSCTKPINESYTISRSKLALYDEAGNAVAYADAIEGVIPESQKDNRDYNPTEVIVTLNKEINKAGTYRLNVPRSFFNLGTQFESVNCAEENDTIIISGNKKAIALDLTPTAVSPDTTETATYEELGTVTLTFAEEVFINENVDATVTFTNAQTRESVAGVAYASGTTVMIQPSTGTIQAGESTSYWTVSVPEALIVNTACTEANFAGGNGNPTLIYRYTVAKKAEGDKDNVVADPADGSKVESVKDIVLTWPDEQMAGNGYTEDLATVTNEKGETLMTFGCYTPEYGIEFNQMNVSLPDALTADGIYTISFPEGFFSFGESGDRSSKAFTLTYYIGVDPSGINGINASKDGKKVIFTLDGKRVEKAVKGLYIINGKKVVVK